MGIVWVIEKPGLVNASMARLLIGDFPVRCFASIDSLETMIRLRNPVLPKVVVLNIGDKNQLEQEKINYTLDRFCPDAHSIIVKTDEFDGVSTSGSRLRTNCRTFIKNNNSETDEFLFEFVKLISSCMDASKRQSASSGSKILFKDIALDFDNHEFQIIPGGEKESLPLKEARLLKFFIENSGKCVSREQIQESVWSQTKVASRTIDSHISRLRKKISFGEVVIESIYGGGYVMK